MSGAWKCLGAVCLVGLGTVTTAMASCQVPLPSGECLPAADDGMSLSLLQRRARETLAARVGGEIRGKESIHYVPPFPDFAGDTKDTYLGP